MKVTVDSDLCEANAVCVSHCAEVFRVSEDDTLTILEADPPERQPAKGETPAM